MDYNSGLGDVGLSEAIGVVRAELEAAIQDGAASNVAFEAGPVELEFEVVFTKSGQGKAGLKAWVVTLGGSAEVSQARTHRMKVTLTPIDRASSDKQLIGDTDPAVAGAQTGRGSTGDVDPE